MKIWITLAALASLSTFASPGNYATVNGIKMYYEIHGPKTGTPLVLIHGGGSTIESAFGKILPLLAAHRPIIAIEEQGHGRTEDRATASSFTQTADDVSALLTHLKIEKVDVLGFSNGASSGLQFAIRHPGKIQKLVFASSFTKRSGAMPGFWDMFKGNKDCLSMIPEPLKVAFLKVNPSEAKLKAMCDKDTARMKNFIETPDRDVKKVTAPTLVLMGDQDVVTVKHGLELVKLFPQARLAVLPGGHGTFMEDVSAGSGELNLTTVTAGLVESFLKGPQ